MKNIFLLLLLSIFAGRVIAQDWQTDIAIAKEIATRENKPIVLVFQGSDWCAPCMKLENEVWSTEEFKSYASTHYVMLKADFPKRSKNALSPEQQEKNNKLADTYNKNGYFPFVVLLDKSGKVLGTLGYKNVSPKEYLELIESFLK